MHNVLAYFSLTHLSYLKLLSFLAPSAVVGPTLGISVGAVPCYSCASAHQANKSWVFDAVWESFFFYRGSYAHAMSDLSCGRHSDRCRFSLVELGPFPRLTLASFNDGETFVLGSMCKGGTMSLVWLDRFYSAIIRSSSCCGLSLRVRVA